MGAQRNSQSNRKLDQYLAIGGSPLSSPLSAVLLSFSHFPLWSVGIGVSVLGLGVWVFSISLLSLTDPPWLYDLQQA